MNWIRNMAKLALVLTWVFSASAWAAGGYVFDAAGDVSVVVGKADAQPATKNDAIASGTLINTGDNSHAVLKFEDGQVVVMQSNSSFQVREYSYEPKQVEKSNIVFAMLKGGMRFVTGLIGQRNRDAFKLNTPNATIGIRGTEFMVAMANNSMYSQVVSGSIGMTNAAGTAVLGAGQTALTASATALTAVVPTAAIPAGTFAQLGAIPVPPVTPAPAPAPAGSAPAGGGAATGGATAAPSAAAASAATGVSATTIAIGVGVAAGVAAIANTTTTTHH
ncbi:MAG TPA: FecR family protein [Gallionella sp.]|nr:FecR family protein [Gallionella sp.]